jgi:hypothetical protein
MCVCCVCGYVVEFMSFILLVLFNLSKLWFFFSLYLYPCLALPFLSICVCARGYVWVWVGGCVRGCAR